MSIYELWKGGHKEHNEDSKLRIQSAVKCLKLIRHLVSFDDVVDIGCGIGAWLYAAKLLGAGSITGYEGSWITENETLIDKEHIQIIDLATEELKLSKRSDLAITIEVAEHLPESAADMFCRTLANCSDYILFSAAIPGQGGRGHFNEQPLNYWVDKFWKIGYAPIEPIRPYIFDDYTVLPWLRQNLIMFIRYDLLIRSEALLRCARPLCDFRLHYRL